MMTEIRNHKKNNTQRTSKLFDVLESFSSTLPRKETEASPLPQSKTFSFQPIVCYSEGILLEKNHGAFFHDLFFCFRFLLIKWKN